MSANVANPKPNLGLKQKLLDEDHQHTVVIRATSSVSKLDAAPGTQEALLEHAGMKKSNTKVARNIYFAVTSDNLSGSSKESKTPVFPSTLMKPGPNTGSKSSTQISSNFREITWIIKLFSVLSGKDGETDGIFRKGGNSVTMAAMMAKINSTYKNSDFNMQVKDVVVITTSNGDKEEKTISVHDIVGVTKKFLLNTTDSLIPVKWHSYWKEFIAGYLREMKDNLKPSEKFSLETAKGLLLLLPSSNFAILRSLLLCLFVALKASNELGGDRLTIEGLIKCYRICVARSPSEDLSSASEGPIPHVLEFLINNHEALFDMTSYLDELDEVDSEDENSGVVAQTPSTPSNTLVDHERLMATNEKIRQEWRRQKEDAKKEGNNRKISQAEGMLAMEVSPELAAALNTQASTPTTREPLQPTTAANCTPKVDPITIKKQYGRTTELAMSTPTQVATSSNVYRTPAATRTPMITPHSRRRPPPSGARGRRPPNGPVTFV